MFVLQTAPVLVCRRGGARLLCSDSGDDDIVIRSHRLGPRRARKRPRDDYLQRAPRSPSLTATKAVRSLDRQPPLERPRNKQDRARALLGEKSPAFSPRHKDKGMSGNGMAGDELRSDCGGIFEGRGEEKMQTMEE